MCIRDSLHLIQNLLIPLCYAYVAANVAWAALGNDGLKRIGGLLKWLITILLSVVLLAFIAYLNLSGVISGGADAATVKAAKFTISNLVPVVGGVISDTAETLLAGASVLRKWNSSVPGFSASPSLPSSSQWRRP